MDDYTFRPADMVGSALRGVYDFTKSNITDPFLSATLGTTRGGRKTSSMSAIRTTPKNNPVAPKVVIPSAVDNPFQTKPSSSVQVVDRKNERAVSNRTAKASSLASIPVAMQGNYGEVVGGIPQGLYTPTYQEQNTQNVVAGRVLSPSENVNQAIESSRHTTPMSQWGNEESAPTTAGSFQSSLQGIFGGRGELTDGIKNNPQLYAEWLKTPTTAMNTLQGISSGVSALGSIYDMYSQYQQNKINQDIYDMQRKEYKRQRQKDIDFANAVNTSGLGTYSSGVKK